MMIYAIARKKCSREEKVVVGMRKDFKFENFKLCAKYRQFKCYVCCVSRPWFRNAQSLKRELFIIMTVSLLVPLPCDGTQTMPHPWRQMKAKASVQSLQIQTSPSRCIDLW